MVHIEYDRRLEFYSSIEPIVYEPRKSRKSRKLPRCESVRTSIYTDNLVSYSKSDSWQAEKLFEMSNHKCRPFFLDQCLVCSTQSIRARPLVRDRKLTIRLDCQGDVNTAGAGLLPLHRRDGSLAFSTWLPILRIHLLIVPS